MDKQVTGYILAGGKSSRMGKDKGLLVLGDRTIVEHIIHAMQPCVSEVVLVANKTGYENFGCRVVHDFIMDKGPMGGIYTALKESPTKYTLIVSCDMPFIKTETMQYLLAQADDSKISVACVGEHLQPLLGIYSRDCVEKLEEYILQDKLKLTSFVLESSPKCIPMEQSGADVDVLFANINTPDDFEWALSRMKK